MKLLLISMLYEPDRVGIAPIATDLARGLAERGHDVTVQATHPYYPEWRRKSDASPWRVQVETLGGVRVERYGLYVPASPSRLLPRLLHELSFPISLLRSLAARRRHDAVIVFCPLMGAVLFGALRRLLRREPTWINVQDIPVDAAVGTGIGRWGALRRVAELVQRVLLNRTDELSSISPAMVERLDALRREGRAVRLVPNWLAEGLARHVDDLPRKEGRAAGSRLRLLYSGNIGKKQALLDFCRQLSATEHGFEFRIIGTGAEGDALRAWLERRGDDRFAIGPFVEEREFVRALHETDLFVITERAGAGASFMPSKLIPCIATGTPILAACDREGPLGHEVATHELGLLTEWGAPSTLESAIDAARDDRLLRRLQDNCRRRSAAYRRATALDAAEALLHRLTGRTAAGAATEAWEQGTP